MQPQPKSVRLLGQTVPVLDEMSWEEMKEMQRLQRRWERDLTGPMEQDLDVAALLLRTRCNVALPAFDENKPFPFDLEELDKAAMILLAPLRMINMKLARNREEMGVAANSPVFTQVSTDKEKKQEAEDKESAAQN